MKVGLIGLGRMGEGMSRRMMKAGHEVWGYRRNHAKAQEAYEKGYISGCTTSLESLVQVIKSTGETGIFQLVIPAELVEGTLNELLPLLGPGDIVIDHGNSNFADSRKRGELLSKYGIEFIDCGTSGGVYGLERGYCLMVGGANKAVSRCAPLFRALAPGIGGASRTDPRTKETSSEFGWLHCGTYGAGHFVKMVHNGVEYGIMQAYAEGFNLLHEANAGRTYVGKGDAEVGPWHTPKTIVTILMLLRLLSCGAVGLLLVVGYSILPLMFYGMIIQISTGLPVALAIVVKVAGLFTVLWISVFPLLYYLLRYLSVSIVES